jgi:hypothetical protein
MYNDCDDADYDEQDEYFYDVDDNNNDVESRQEIDENVEMENDPPSDGLFSKVFFLASPYSPSLTS